MAFACPHCGSHNFSFGEVLRHSMRLSGPRAPLVCARCGRRSYVGLRGRNAALALTILAVAFVSSFPSPFSETLFSRFEAPWPAVIRAQIWSAGILLSFGLFMFGAPLERLDDEQSVEARFTAWGHWVRLLFLSVLLLWMFLIGRGLAYAS